jgi:carboxyl-terminal processing protease
MIEHRRTLRPPLPKFALAVALAVLLAGCATTPAPRISLAGVPAVAVGRAQANVRVFERVWSLVKDAHFDPKLQGVDWEAAGVKYGAEAAAAPDEVALYRSLNAMLAPLHDSHTHALTPARATERRTRVRARTGFNMTRVEERWVVSEVLPGSPAEDAGVKPGWIVVAREGVSLGARIDFRPKEGEAASWDFLDNADRPVRLAPVAKPLSTAPRQIVRVLDGGYVYLRFDEFNGPGRRWLSRELKQHAAAPGVVIDLRQNPGGETISLGIVIGEFFDRSVDCGTFITRGGSRSMKNSWQLGSAHYHGKAVVLVDGATGSAAEIFAAVLQDHGRATLIGRRTAGAVLASWFYTLPDRGQLQLSREDYMAPKGRRIEGAGIEPDIVVSRTLADLRAGRDRDLEEAVGVLQRGRDDPAEGGQAAR